MRGENTPIPETSEAQCSTVIHCDVCLDIAGVEELYDRLHAALEAHRPIILETAQVERIDTAALQIFCAFFQEAQVRGMLVSWQQPSPALCTAARLLDLTACLGLPTD